VTSASGPPSVTAARAATVTSMVAGRSVLGTPPARPVAVLAMVLVALITLLAVPPAAVAVPRSGTPGVRLELQTATSAALTPGSSYALTGAVRNTGSTVLRSLTVRLRLDWPRLTAEEITAWLAGEGPRSGVIWASTAMAGPLTPGSSAAFTVGGPADALGLPIRDGFGPRGVGVELIGDDGTGARRLTLRRTVLVWDPGEDVGVTNLSVLAPITPAPADAGTDAASPTPSLVQQWQDGGRLARILAATADPAVAWALDPALLSAAARAERPSPSSSPAAASITPTGGGTPTRSTGGSAAGPATGSSGLSTSSPPAPSTSGGTAATGPGAATTTPVDPVAAAAARTWSQALLTGSRDRDVYALPWADPDLAALAAVGAGDLLNAAEEDGAAAARQAFGRDVDTSLAWPVDGRADAATLDLVRGAPGRTVVLSPASLPTATSPEQGATGRIALPGDASDGTTAILTDPDLSAALGAMGGDQPLLATQRTLALLAARSVTVEPGQSTAVLAALPRSWDPRRPTGLVNGLADLRSRPWIHVERVSVAREREPGPGPAALSRTVAARQLPADHVRRVIDSFRRLLAFAPALVDPQVSYRPTRRAALSLVSQRWRRPDLSAAERARALTAARTPLLTQVDRYYSSVGVVAGSTVTLTATRGPLPVTVTSALREPVRLVVSLAPTSARLRTGKAQVVTLDASRTGTARANAFPEVVAVSNGDVDVAAILSSPTGGPPLVEADHLIRVRIRHDWENRALAGSVAVLVALLVIGLVRSVRGGRRARVPLDTVPDPDEVALIAAGERAPTPPYGVARGRDRGPEFGPGLGPDRVRSPAPHGKTNRTDTVEEDHGEPAGTRSLMRSSALMSAGTLVSRILGWVRASVLSAAIGGAAAGSAFATANTLPNNVFILIGGGALNAVLVPQLVRAAKRADDGVEYTDRLLTLATLVLGGATVVATLAAPLLIRLYSGGWDRPTIDLGTAFALWCLPQIFFYGLYTLYGQVLNARGSFGPYMWAPVVNNIVAIAGMGVFIGLAGAGEKPVTGWSAGDVALLAGTATLGVVANALVLIPVMRRAGYRWRPRWGWRGIGLRSAGSIAAWTFAGVALAQVGFVIISRVVNAAGNAAQREGIPAGRAVFDFAYMIFMMPHSLIAVSVVTAVFTRVSAQAAEGNLAAVRADLSLALRTVSVATMFATAAFVALGPQFTAALFPGTSRVTTDQYALVATAMLLGIVPFSAGFLFQRVSFAFEDARTPFWIGTLGTVLWTAGTLLVPTVLAPRYVPAGVGLAMAVTNLITALIWVPVLRRRLGSIDGTRIVGTLARLLLAAAGAVAIGILVREGAQVVVGDRGLAAVLIVLACAGGVMTLTYVLLLWALRVSELDTLLRPLLSRVRR